MRVDLRTLEPNPMRDFRIDPVDETVVESLKHSIEEDGFWGGIVCRQLADGRIQIGAGQHRVRAALAAGYTIIDAFVAQNMTDATMVRVYARENATQRGNTSTALAGTIASAVRLKLKEVLTDRTSPEFWRGSDRYVETILGHLEHGRGLGRDVILAFLKGIPGINTYSVDSQLANLNASGDYARIIYEVQEEIERENQEALARLAAIEAEQQQLEQERLEAEARAKAAEEERKAAAARARVAQIEAERRRQAEAAKAAEVARERAKAEAQLAEQRRKERDTQLKEFEQLRQTRDTGRAAAAKAKEQPKTFDFEGVAEYIKSAHQVNVFRQMVTGPGLRDRLPIENQADLAHNIVDAAKRQGRELTGAFIREEINREYFNARANGRSLDQETQEDTTDGDPYHKALELQQTFSYHVRQMASVGLDIIALLKRWPSDLTFPISGEFRHGLQSARQVLNELSQEL